MSNFTAVITVNFTGTSYGSSDTFTVRGVTSGNTPATGVSKAALEAGYTYTYAVAEIGDYPTAGFEVISEEGNSVCENIKVGDANGGAPEATATPTPTPTPGPGGTSTPTPTPTPEPPQLNFFIQDQEYSSEGQAWAGLLPGTSVFVTASVGTFDNFVNNLGTFTTAEKTIYLDNGLTPGNEFGGTGLFHLADSDGVGPGTHALRVSSGVVDLAIPCNTPTPTPTPQSSPVEVINCSTSATAYFNVTNESSIPVGFSILVNGQCYEVVTSPYTGGEFLVDVENEFLSPNNQGCNAAECQP